MGFKILIDLILHSKIQLRCLIFMEQVKTDLYFHAALILACQGFNVIRIMI